MDELLRDRKGTSTITNILLLPLFILVLLGAAQIWQIIATRQSLNVSVYRTASCLSKYRDIGLCRDLLETSVMDIGLGDNVGPVRYYRYENETDMLLIDESGDITTIQNWFRSNCGEQFAVEASLTFSRDVIIPFLPARRMTFAERRSSYVDCSPHYGILEETPIAPLN